MTDLPDTHRREIRTGIQGAIERAERDGAPVLVRVHAPLTDRDPWLHLDGATGARLAWADAQAELEFAALGVARTIEASGEGRFAAVRREVEALLAHVSDVSVVPGTPNADSLFANGERSRWNQDLPLLVGGFAFDSAPPGGVWAGWPAGLLIVPERLIYRGAGGTCGVIAQRSVSAGDDAERVAAEIAASIAAVVPVPQVSDPARVGEVDLWPHESHAHWCERVYAARGAVGTGQVDKLMLARSVQIEPKPGTRLSVVGTLRNLRARDPSVVTFALDLGEGSAFVGASPSTLVRVRGRKVRTAALAATAPRGESSERDAVLARRLMDSRKDSIEHAAVVEAMTLRLGAICSSLECAPAPSIRRLTDVQHLETPMTGELREASGVLTVVEALHPTPSVAGAPCEAALRWLQREESLERGWYAGPVGWVDRQGDGHFVVGIRSALLEPQRGTAYVGAGIVNASRPVGEWRETELKLRTLAESLATR